MQLERRHTRSALCQLVVCYNYYRHNLSVVFTARCTVKRGVEIACRPSVRLSVTLVDQDHGSHTGWAKKSKPDNFCNNFVYRHPIFIIFGTYTLQEICNRRMYS